MKLFDNKPSQDTAPAKKSSQLVVIKRVGELIDGIYAAHRKFNKATDDSSLCQDSSKELVAASNMLTGIIFKILIHNSSVMPGTNQEVSSENVEKLTAQLIKVQETQQKMLIAIQQCESRAQEHKQEIEELRQELRTLLTTHKDSLELKSDHSYHIAEALLNEDPFPQRHHSQGADIEMPASACLGSDHFF